MQGAAGRGVLIVVDDLGLAPLRPAVNRPFAYRTLSPLNSCCKAILLEKLLLREFAMQ
jgi:hypothetical protein